MKNIKMTIAIFAMLVISLPAFAATTGTLTLTGTVNGNVEIIVTPEAIASSLDLLTDATDLKVATVTEKSNTAYTVTVQSANSASLTGKNAGTPDTLPYSLKYDGSAVSFSGDTATITDTATQTGASGVDKDLTISYTADSSLQADTYEDVLTFTIAAK
jgi:type 1 fimbria pilin